MQVEFDSNLAFLVEIFFSTFNIFLHTRIHIYIDKMQISLWQKLTHKKNLKNIHI